jgi:hypothetical protein
MNVEISKDLRVGGIGRAHNQEKNKIQPSNGTRSKSSSRERGGGGGKVSVMPPRTMLMRLISSVAIPGTHEMTSVAIGSGKKGERPATSVKTKREKELLHSSFQDRRLVLRAV